MSELRDQLFGVSRSPRPLDGEAHEQLRRECPTDSLARVTGGATEAPRASSRSLDAGARACVEELPSECALDCVEVEPKRMLLRRAANDAPRLHEQIRDELNIRRRLRLDPEFSRCPRRKRVRSHSLPLLLYFPATKCR